MRIGDRHIGPPHPPYVIAEIGVNHDGSPARAAALIEAAASAGADAVKLQCFRADLLLSRAARLTDYQRLAGERDPLDMLRRLEIPPADMGPLITLAHARGIHAIVTIFSLDLVEETLRLPWDACKSASPDIIHKPLLRAIAATGKPLIVSTGASTLDEVRTALQWLADARHRLALLQCVSAYPVPHGQEAFDGIDALRDIFQGPVGYSDHTTGIEAATTAVTHGAAILEKHITDDTSRPGPDHAASLTPDLLATYIEKARAAHNSASTRTPNPAPAKRILDCERDVRQASRQSLVTTRDLPDGHVITRDDLTFKRPGTGFPPYALHDVIGRRTAHPVRNDWPLCAEDLA